VFGNGEVVFNVGLGVRLTLNVVADDATVDFSVAVAHGGGIDLVQVFAQLLAVLLVGQLVQYSKPFLLLHLNTGLLRIIFPGGLMMGVCMRRRIGCCVAIVVFGGDFLGM